MSRRIEAQRLLPTDITYLEARIQTILTISNDYIQQGLLNELPHITVKQKILAVRWPNDGTVRRIGKPKYTIIFERDWRTQGSVWTFQVWKFRSFQDWNAILVQRGFVRTSNELVETAIRLRKKYEIDRDYRFFHEFD